MDWNLTIQVLNLSSRATLADLNNFFSYCGTVENIQMLSHRTKDGSQSALVTFRLPYAFQTALLLNNAILLERPICILPAGVVQIPIISDHEDNSDNDSADQLLNLKKQEESGVVHATGPGIGSVAEQAAGRISLWISDVVQKASKFASDLQQPHATNKTNNPNSRKQK
ncbi:Nucleotide-binding alpha-beta plait domain containing protein [Parasponia andersonii]|uniref:Nucleotide-binding alpha-beta plait domain containing protein n=1 Tax=Parasponia andersonii TaxID=3476 RepID=A0A2P5C7I9_PARAD|nr:Nucleotide-binding alpha-beta plait domain containing protein [Parasponia andersonii]